MSTESTLALAHSSTSSTNSVDATATSASSTAAKAAKNAKTASDTLEAVFESAAKVTASAGLSAFSTDLKKAGSSTTDSFSKVILNLTSTILGAASSAIKSGQVPKSIPFLVLLFPPPGTSTKTTAPVLVTDLTINVEDTKKFGSTGVIQIGSEQIKYTGKTKTSFTGLTRGIHDTTPVAYPTVGTTVTPPQNSSTNAQVLTALTFAVTQMRMFNDPNLKGAILAVESLIVIVRKQPGSENYVGKTLATVVAKTAFKTEPTRSSAANRKAANISLWAARENTRFALAENVARTEIVQPGDTIIQLASRYLGDAGRWHELVILNNLNQPYVSDTPTAYPGSRVLGPTDAIRIPTTVGDAMSIPGDSASSVYGVDIAWESDLRNIVRENPEGSFGLDRGVNNLVKAVYRAIITRPGELPTRPGYGNRAFDHLGESADVWRAELAAVDTKAAILAAHPAITDVKVTATWSNGVLEINAIVTPVPPGEAFTVNTSIGGRRA